MSILTALNIMLMTLLDPCTPEYQFCAGPQTPWTAAIVQRGQDETELAEVSRPTEPPERPERPERQNKCD